MTLHLYWTYFETQKGPNYLYEQSFFVWRLLPLYMYTMIKGTFLCSTCTVVPTSTEVTVKRAMPGSII